MRLVNCETREKIFFVTRELTSVTREIRFKHFVNPTENCWSNEKFFVQKKGCKNFLPKKILVFQKIQKNPKHMGQKTMIRWDFIVFSVIFGPKIELVVIRGNSRVDFSNSWLVNSRVNSRVHELRGHTGIMRY